MNRLWRELIASPAPTSFDLQAKNQTRLLEAMRASQPGYQNALAACKETANTIAEEQGLPGRISSADLNRFDRQAQGATWAAKVSLYAMRHIHGLDLAPIHQDA